MRVAKPAKTGTLSPREHGATLRMLAAFLVATMAAPNVEPPYALAQDRTPSNDPASNDPAAIERGRLVVVGGARDARVGACFSCHGLDGAGDPVAGVPRVAGQGAWYLAKQLRDYASGVRPNPIMTPVAEKMTAEEMMDSAAYYAAADAPSASAIAADATVPGASLFELGENISTHGVPEKNVPSCVSCHGEAGAGRLPTVPYLTGQHAGYIVNQLILWGAGIRRNGPLNVMDRIGERLNALEMEALGAYFATVQPEEP